MSRGWLERWFGDRRNLTVINMVQEHLGITKNAVQELYNMVYNACEGKADKNELYNRIADLEKRADQIRRDMVDELTKREIFPTEREDLMELVRAVDWIADWARESGRILLLLPIVTFPEDMKTSICNMCKTNVSCVTVLSNSIKTLSKDASQAIELSNEVEMLEEEIDEQYSACRKHLADLNYPEYKVGILILLNEFLDSVEMISERRTCMALSEDEAVEEVTKCVDQGFLCVEAVLKTLADAKGVESEYIPAIATGMGAGVGRTGQICGAVTGCNSGSRIMVWQK
jgi:predicted phosphate transport protein (TIGR00153 family)